MSENKNDDGIVISWVTTKDQHIRKAFADKLEKTHFDKKGRLRCRSNHVIDIENAAPSGDGVQCRKCSQVYNRLHYYMKQRGYWWLHRNLQVIINKAPHVRLPKHVECISNEEPPKEEMARWNRKLLNAK